jgi:hypothetical protein
MGRPGAIGQRVAASAGGRAISAVVRRRRANAICERVIGTLRPEVLDRLLIVNEHHLRQVLTEYLAHYNAARRTVPSGSSPRPKSTPARWSRRNSPSTGSAASKSSADSPTSTTSPPYRPRAATEEHRSPAESYFRAPQVRRLTAGRWIVVRNPGKRAPQPGHSPAAWPDTSPVRVPGGRLTKVSGGVVPVIGQRMAHLEKEYLSTAQLRCWLRDYRNYAITAIYLNPAKRTGSNRRDHGNTTKSAIASIHATPLIRISNW